MKETKANIVKKSKGSLNHNHNHDDRKWWQRAVERWREKWNTLDTSDKFCLVTGTTLVIGQIASDVISNITEHGYRIDYNPTTKLFSFRPSDSKDDTES